MSPRRCHKTAARRSTPTWRGVPRRSVAWGWSEARLRPVREIENAWIELADGCRLAARIWLPEDAESDPVPAILEYLPYRKRDGTAMRDQLTHPYFAGHGYAAVRVDMRGNGESDGLMWDEYVPQEQDDALEVIAWLARQTWCSGQVGMIGISWGGFNGLQVAARRPPALKAVVSICSTVDRYADDIHWKGGCLLNENLGWSATMHAYSSRPPDPALVGERWRDMWLERLENEPLLIETWLDHQRRDAYWKHGSVCEDYGAIEAAVLAVGGWGDAYKNAVMQLVGNLRAPVKGILGPWLHKYPHFAVPRPAIAFLQECLRWWDRWLKGVDTGVERDPPLRAYLQDGLPPRTFYDERPGRWVAEPEWPSPSIEPTEFTFAEGGLLRLEPISPSSVLPAKAGTHPDVRSGGAVGPGFPGGEKTPGLGRLPQDRSKWIEKEDISMRIRGDSDSDVAISAGWSEFSHSLFRRDDGDGDGFGTKGSAELLLRSPQTTGSAGGEYCAIWLGAEAPGDQRFDDAGSLMVDTPPLAERLEILGTPVVDLFLTSDRQQGFVVVRLCEVFPDGASARVTYGVLNLAHRDGSEHPSAVPVGEPIRLRVRLDDVGHAFLAGSRIRVAVSNAYWPLVWPSPEPATLRLHPAGSRLTLPARPRHDEVAPAFAEPEAAAPLALVLLRPARNRRELKQDMATGTLRLEIEDDFGASRDPGHGLETGSIGRETYSIRPDDPLSARAECHWTMTLGRGDWRVRTETRSTLTADRTHFTVEGSLDAYEGDALLFSRRWHRRIPRDMM